MASVTGYLSFDPTDANSIAASASVGSYVRAGTDGTLIGAVSDALKVNFSNTSIAVTDGGGSITVDGTVAVTQSTSPWVIGDGGGSITIDGSVATGAEKAEDAAHASGNVGNFVLGIRVDDLTAVPSTALAGTELDYQGLISDANGALFTASWLFASNGDAITATGSSLNVNVTNAGNDDLANTAIENTTTAVSTTAVNIVSSALASRKWVALANEGNIKLFFGKNGVTTSNGFPMYAKEKSVWRIGPSVAPQIIGGTGASSEDLRVMELS